MAKISRGENGLLIDGEPFDPNGIQELSDEELEAASGGVKIYTKQENHWWGDKYIYLVCGSCGGADWTVTGWYDTNKLYVTCNNCGSSYVKRNSGYEYMVSGLRATCDYCGSSNVETHFMRMIQEGYYPSSQFR